MARTCIRCGGAVSMPLDAIQNVRIGLTQHTLCGYCTERFHEWWEQFAEQNDTAVVR